VLLKCNRSTTDSRKEKGKKEAKGLWQNSSNKSLHGQARISEEFDLMKQFFLAYNL